MENLPQQFYEIIINTTSSGFHHLNKNDDKSFFYLHEIAYTLGQADLSLEPINTQFLILIISVNKQFDFVNMKLLRQLYYWFGKGTNQGIYMDGNILELENLLIRLKNQIRAQQKIFWMIRQAYLINIEQLIIQEITLKLIFIKLINYQQVISLYNQIFFWQLVKLGWHQNQHEALINMINSEKLVSYFLLMMKLFQLFRELV